MSLATFNALVQFLEPQKVFQKKFSKSQEQMPMNWQILITFFEMGCYENGASLTKIATLAGVRYGIIN